MENVVALVVEMNTLFLLKPGESANGDSGK